MRVGSIVDDLPHARWGADVVYGTTLVTVVPMAVLSLLSSISALAQSALVSLVCLHVLLFPSSRPPLPPPLPPSSRSRPLHRTDPAQIGGAANPPRPTLGHGRFVPRGTIPCLHETVFLEGKETSAHMQIIPRSDLFDFSAPRRPHELIVGSMGTKHTICWT